MKKELAAKYEHLEVEKPKPKEDRAIFIPEVKKETNREEN